MNPNSVLAIGSFDCNDRAHTFLVSSQLGVPDLSWDALGGPGGDISRQGSLYAGELVERIFVVRILGNDGDDLDARVNALREQVPGCDAAPDEATVTIGMKGRTLTGTLRARKSKRIDAPVGPLFVSGDEVTVEVRLACEPYVYTTTETLANAASVTLPGVVDISAQSGQYATPYDLLFSFGGGECNALYAGWYPDEAAVIDDFVVQAALKTWTGGANAADTAGYPDGVGDTVRGNQSATEIYMLADTHDFEPGEYLVLAKCKATTANTGTIRHTYCSAVSIPSTSLQLLSLGVVSLPCEAVRGTTHSHLPIYLAGDGTNYGYLNAVFFIPVSFGGMVGWRPASGHAHTLRFEDELLYADDVADLGHAVGGRRLRGFGGVLVAIAEKVTPAPTTAALVTVIEEPRWEQLPSDAVDSEHLLVVAETVAASSSCPVVAYVVPTGAELVTFRVACDQPHTVAFYGADADFSDIADAALMPDETRTFVSSTAGTSGNLFLVDPGASGYLACVVTNNGLTAATVSVGAQ